MNYKKFIRIEMEPPYNLTYDLAYKLKGYYFSDEVLRNLAEIKSSLISTNMYEGGTYSITSKFYDDEIMMQIFYDSDKEEEYHYLVKVDYEKSSDSQYKELIERILRSTDLIYSLRVLKDSVVIRHLCGYTKYWFFIYCLENVIESVINLDIDMYTRALSDILADEISKDFCGIKPFLLNMHDFMCEWCIYG